MKKTIFSILFLYCSVTTLGQTSAEMLVQQFGNNLRDWCSTKDIIYRKKAQEQCTDACRVKDQIMEDFVANSGLIVKDYVVPNYLNCFENALEKGNVSISMRNVKTIMVSEQSYRYSYDAKRIEKLAKEITTIACEIITDGALKYHIKDLYYIRNGKIVKITPYEEVIDQKTGKKKVKVDFSNIVSDFFYDIIDRDFDALGVSLGYSKHFPLNLGIHYNVSLFNIGIEIGGSWENKPIGKGMSDGVETTIYSKGLYGVLTPGVFLEYATINLGVGFTTMEEKSNDVFLNNKAFFIMKPSVEFNIPLPLGKYSDPICFLCPRIAYNHVPKLQQLNCWEVGLCFRYIIAD